MAGKRALHFVFKVGDRHRTSYFYREILGMKFLRHEEFEEGCKASCNGPYDGKWSKSMVGYGPEDNHFVVELTYNYGIGSYKLGTDFKGITICSKAAVSNVREKKWPAKEADGRLEIDSPDGYKFFLLDEEKKGDPVQKVAIGASNLQQSIDYWHEKLGMSLVEKSEKSALLGFGDDQCKLELIDNGGPVDHATAFGRIAFSCPREQLPPLQKKMEEEKQKILTPLVSLDTPGKATVEVVILADPDDHEICFVGDEAFRELSQVDPKADALLNEGLEKDKSNEWFAKRGGKKAN